MDMITKNNIVKNQMETGMSSSRSVIDLEKYEGAFADSKFNEWEVVSLLDDTLMVSYLDSPEGESRFVNRGGVFVDTKSLNKSSLFRIGEIMLSGPRATLKAGTVILFPDDKGLKAANINGKKNVVFLNEARVFGVVSRKNECRA